MTRPTLKHMGPEDYVVCIPSYRRPMTLATKTLPLLIRRGVDPARITVVLASDAELADYQPVLSMFGVAHSIAAPSIRAARLHIMQMHPVGAPVAMVDDDVEDVSCAVDSKTLIPVANLDQLFLDGFRESRDRGCYLWGISPVANAFYLRPDHIHVGLKFVIGTLFGYWQREHGHYTQDLVLDEKDDYERTLRYYEHDGKVMRFDGVTLKSRFYREPGGMQTYRTVEDSHVSAHYLLGRWPSLVRLNKNRVGERAEIILRAPRSVKKASVA